MIDPMDDAQTSKINEEANSPTMHGDKRPKGCGKTILTFYHMREVHTKYS
jgi:hypothetical protein